MIIEQENNAIHHDASRQLTENEKAYVITEHKKKNGLTLFTGLMILGLIVGSTIMLVLFYSKAPEQSSIFSFFWILMNVPFTILMIMVFQSFISVPQDFDGTFSFTGKYNRRVIKRFRAPDFIKHYIGSVPVLPPKHWGEQDYLQTGRSYSCKAYPMEINGFFDQRTYGSNKLFILLALEDTCSIENQYDYIKKEKPLIPFWISVISGTLLLIMTLFLKTGDNPLVMSWRFMANSEGQNHRYESVSDFLAASPRKWQSIIISNCLALKSESSGYILLDTDDPVITEIEQDLIPVLQARAEAFSILKNMSLRKITPEKLKKIDLLSNLKAFDEFKEILNLSDIDLDPDDELSIEKKFEVDLSMIALFTLKKSDILESMYKQEAEYLNKITHEKYYLIESTVKLDVYSLYRIRGFSAWDVESGKTLEVLNDRTACMLTPREVKGIITVKKNSYWIDSGKEYKPGQLFLFSLCYFSILLLFAISTVIAAIYYVINKGIMKSMSGSAS